MKISLVIPSRNNLKYLKWSYESIRKNQGDHEVQICVADDASTDGTKAWLERTAMDDPNLSFIVNDGGTRLGHTILYDKLVNEVAQHDLCMIFHADMYLAKGALDAIEKHMYTVGKQCDCKCHEPDSQMRHMRPCCYPGRSIPNKKTIVSLTRVEPPLHPDGVEKIIKDFGTEPEEFSPAEFDAWVQWYLRENEPRTTEGIFAPWAFWKSDFQEIGGHDPLFAPQSKEDSDIFNRFQLNGVKFIQTWEGFVYHMTCRGSRRNTHDGAPNIHTNNPEWELQNIRSSRNFIRKWGHFVKHDPYMKPIIPHRYDIGIVIYNANMDLLRALEPWAVNIHVDLGVDIVKEYIDSEQPNTMYDLSRRVKRTNQPATNDIVVMLDGHMLSQADAQYIQILPDILEDSGEVGEMGIGNLKLFINRLDTYEDKLIVCRRTEEKLI